MKLNSEVHATAEDRTTDYLHDSSCSYQLSHHCSKLLYCHCYKLLMYLIIYSENTWTDKGIGSSASPKRSLEQKSQIYYTRSIGFNIRLLPGKFYHLSYFIHISDTLFRVPYPKSTNSPNGALLSPTCPSICQSIQNVVPKNFLTSHLARQLNIHPSIHTYIHPSIHTYIHTTIFIVFIFIVLWISEPW